MKLFEEPKLEMIVFTVEDVVSTSPIEEELPGFGGMLDPMGCVS